MTLRAAVVACGSEQVISTQTTVLLPGRWTRFEGDKPRVWGPDEELRVRVPGMQTVDDRTPRGLQLHSGRHVVLQARLIGQHNGAVELPFNGMRVAPAWPNAAPSALFYKPGGDKFGRRYGAVELRSSDTLVIDTVVWWSGRYLPLP